jgi:hypothetical protein
MREPGLARLLDSKKGAGGRLFKWSECFQLRAGVAAAVALVLCAILTACVGAVRLPARDRGPNGVQLQKNEIDLGFLDTPNLHRDEVVQKFARVDTGYQSVARSRSAIPTFALLASFVI